jgi:3-hydroxy acid dehydrogenase/malonic semialdehyde reductase
LQAGANVVLLARRTDVLETVADACRAAHVSAKFTDAQVVALAFDVGNKAQTAGLLARLPTGLPAPDILVNNAGIVLASGLVGSLADHDVEKTFAVNIVGLIGLTQHFVRCMPPPLSQIWPHV